ncbi:unnamed protein product [Rotaria socialis]|uniref:mannose-6-phosphate isomerase n=1 Tax=Rotaria socialis TaxID=392032 RepID=A0A821F1L6_9BILA|nr:unnamed protein product [Rotaria socialis]CAF4646318.1 unnamed protein product [Rotaria socialis]
MIPEPIFKIEGAVQHYDWGGHHFIPSLMGIANERQQPFAESWYGGHSMHPSLLVDKQGRKWPLSELIKNNPVAYLGDSTEKQFPFLLKLLDVKNMLSIQAHPNKTQAQKGFSKENELHIPFNASNRNYKDANHKPEMMVALSDFWLLHGFKNESDLMATLRSHTELDEFVQHFQAGGYQQLLHYLMNLPMVAVEDILKPILPRLPRVDKNHYGYWMNNTSSSLRRHLPARGHVTQLPLWTKYRADGQQR